MADLRFDLQYLVDRLKSYGVPEPVRELRFYRGQRWRFDLAWPQRKVAIERHGMGRHIRPKGFIADRSKMNTATAIGWRVIEFTPWHLEPGQVQHSVKLVLCTLGMISFEEVEHGLRRRVERGSN